MTAFIQDLTFNIPAHVFTQVGQITMDIKASDWAAPSGKRVYCKLCRCSGFCCRREKHSQFGSVKEATANIVPHFGHAHVAHCSPMLHWLLTSSAWNLQCRNGKTLCLATADV